MTIFYPIVLETEDSGAVSAYVPGLPVYAAAETHAKAERAIRAVLTDLPRTPTRPVGQRHASAWHASPNRGKPTVDIVGVAALVGARRTPTKARASRLNGRLGGRPRRTDAAARARAKAAR